jgi:alpha-tubulin suppressor-like RCC1 family protein/endonuclease/exonuclease/phosphatase family metal-dependent hydrolase
VVVALALVVTVAVAPWPSGPSHPPRAETVADALRPTGCADALVVGLDGNGQQPAPGDTFGPTVDTVVRQVVARAKARGRSVSVARVPLRTLPASAVLAHQRRPDQNTLRAISKHGIRSWREPVFDGARTTLALVTDRIARCPERPVLLVGFAQGASVVHRVLGRVAQSGGLSHLVGGIAIADPDRLARSVARPILGAPHAPVRRAGIFPAFLTAHADVPRSHGSFGEWSVCTRADLICDPSRASVRDSLAAARGEANHRRLLRSVADDAWRQLALWPVPALRHQVVTASVGQALHLQLALAPRAPAGSLWSDATGLPPGVTLSGSGLLAGKPTRSGTFVVAYQTRGTAPTTTGHSGTVLVKVTPSSVSLSAGGQGTCLTRSDGTARCWGRNNYGQIGDGTLLGRAVPTPVIGKGWATISTSGSTTCGVKGDGTLWCWGLDNFGQVGIGRGAPVRTPHQLGVGRHWAGVSTAYSHTCATKTDGTLWCWGENLHGQLGIGTIDRSHGSPQRVGTRTDWKSVTTGGWHSCAVTSAGAAYCWGANDFGELGDGTVTTRTRPTVVAGGTSWLQLSAAWAQTCGVTQAGGMMCWGFNRQGQLGRGDTTNSALPVAVTGDQVWTQVAAGDGSTCGIDSAGQMWCWGDNRYGQVGQPPSGALTRAPAAVTGVVAPVALASAGWLHTCAIPTGQPFVCWGNDEAGQVGNGVDQTTAAPSVRHQVPLRRADLPSDRFLDHASPDRIAAGALASRPMRSLPRTTLRRATVSPFTIMSMNMLGTQHTAPGGDEPTMAPGRLRAEWASTYVRMRGASLVGMQEPQPDQIVALDSATRHAFTFYPGNSMGYRGAPQSVMWERARWKMTWHSSISIPFTGGWRPQPIVRLQQRSTGTQVYWINVHFSARRANQADRNTAMKILLRAIARLTPDGLPILLTGDFNEITPAFCSITGKTPLVAATGGSNIGGRCLLPPRARIDWIFGSRGAFSGALMDDSAQVRRTTDHHVLSARFGTG